MLSKGYVRTQFSTNNPCKWSLLYSHVLVYKFIFQEDLIKPDSKTPDEHHTFYVSCCYKLEWLESMRDKSAVSVLPWSPLVIQLSNNLCAALYIWLDTDLSVNVVRPRKSVECLDVLTLNSTLKKIMFSFYCIYGISFSTVLHHGIFEWILNQLPQVP